MNIPTITQLTQDIEAKLDELLIQHRVPGVAVGVVLGNEELVVCRGVTSSFHPLPVTEDTLFHIGSTTKTITATAIMQCVAAGSLDLHTPIQHYLPDFHLSDPIATQQVTVQHCLSHSVGWVGDVFARQGEGDDALARYVKHLQTLPQLTPPGMLFAYNNAAFGVLGRALEVVYGASYEDIVTQQVLVPLGMQDSLFDLEAVMVKRFAVGHVSDPQGNAHLALPWGFGRAIHAIGGIKSSITDQLQYLRFCLDGNPDVLNTAMQHQMYQPLLAANDLEAIGLSWFSQNINTSDGRAVTIIRHGGATNGQMSSFWFIPQLQFGFTIMGNSDKAGLLNEKLSTWLRGYALGLPKPTVVPLDRPIAEYLGRYIGPAFGTAIEITERNGVIMRSVIPGDTASVTATPPSPPLPARCQLIHPESLIITEGEFERTKYEFIRDDSGAIAWLRAAGRLYKKES
jgi:CubicO group peptidase (beta-lactamase class C family)